MVSQSCSGACHHNCVVEKCGRACCNFYAPPLDATVRFLHIPKSAGTSTVLELRNMGVRVPSSIATGQMETCLPSYYRPRPHTWHMAMLRRPEAHVISQYLYCRTSTFGVDYARFDLKRFANPTLSPSLGLAQWAEHWLQAPRRSQKEEPSGLASRAEPARHWRHRVLGAPSTGAPKTGSPR